MCAQLPFDYELGETDVLVYPSEEVLKRARKCVNKSADDGFSRCEIVRVKIERAEEENDIQS